VVWQDYNPVSFILDHKVFSISYTPSSSAAKLAYQDAQRVIDGKPLGEALVDATHGASRVEKDINILQSLASKLKARRFQEGTLSLEVLSLAFKLDENGLPIDCGQYKRTEANYLVEEVGCQSVIFTMTLLTRSSLCY
jgi:exoribonuclease R